MGSARRIESRPWWPEAVQLFAEMAEAGATRVEASMRAAKTFGPERSTFRKAIERGSVPAYPATDAVRAAAILTIGSAWRNTHVVSIGGTTALRRSNLVV